MLVDFYVQYEPKDIPLANNGIYLLDNDIASFQAFMTTLLKKVKSEHNSPQYIQSHFGIGYRMMRVK